jgi:hypothetical protein
MWTRNKMLAVVAVAILSIASSISYAARSSGNASAENDRRKAAIALLTLELAKTQAPTQTSAPAQQPQVPYYPLMTAPTSAVEKRNVTQVTPSLPSDALCNSRSDPATYLQCCEMKRNGGTLDATCPMYVTGGKITN